MNDLRLSVPCLVLALASLAGCSSPPAAQAVSTDQPASAAAPASSGAKTLTGTVAETMDAGSYTYVRVTSGTEEIWAAAGRFQVAVGDRVVVPLEMRMENFHSQTLNRDFPVIYFVTSITKEGSPAPLPMAAAHGPMQGHPAPGAGAAPVTEDIAAPAGGTRVADVWANRTGLAGKTITVRGKVTKFNGGILGRNWLHLQDGSGKADEGTHDLAVTSAAGAKVGDIVTVTGTLAIDKDFGAGYTYPVILEDARIEPK